jgi:hypothetical protein
VSSSGYAESGADSDPREKDKKVRKNSVFGNLFKKKTKKSSKDEDVVREEEPVEIKVTAIAAPIQSEADRSGNSLDNEWNNPVRLRIDQKPEAMNNPPTIAVNEQYEKSKHTPTGAEISKELVLSEKADILTVSRCSVLKLRRGSQISIRTTMPLLLRPMAAAA